MSLDGLRSSIIAICKQYSGNVTLAAITELPSGNGVELSVDKETWDSPSFRGFVATIESIAYVENVSVLLAKRE